MNRYKYRYTSSILFWAAITALFMIVMFLVSAEPYQQQDLRPALAQWISESTLQAWLPHIEFPYGGGLVSWTRPYDFVEFFIRKSAHVFEYLLLTLLWMKLLGLLRLKLTRYVILSCFLSFLFAATDEWHQSIVPGRTGHAIDLAVDSIGIVLAAVIYLVFRHVYSKKNSGDHPK